MITEEMLREAAHKASEVFTAYYERDYNPENQYVFPPEFEKKIERLKRRAKHPGFYKTMHRVASIILTILIAGGTWITVDAEARATFVGWIKEVCGTFFVYRYSGEVNNEVGEEIYRPDWIPDGYTEIYADDTSDGGNILYENANGNYLQFFYFIRPEESNLFIENTDTVKQRIAINGQPGDYIKSNNPEISDSIIWTNEQEHLFYVAGFLDEDELLRFAESIK